ncbi:MAG TPA: hypoxanthine phosphoribosyltransferase [Candidatus Caccalectryoclostridium excrementigallinarum]|uniref:Hypoxanthine phosphoribosyltransferase n=1 Tax=Candidatus Caccalectryoclostridium excrementigallinarum TaxID=2840710 RepID=A0A9D1ML02_9FIRM|nr:hypoxanthine phosphoribosyltransferase [Candidatus Caccalectryoclostridium excrementigallinarum]
MNYVIDKVLVAEEDIRRRVDELGKEITRDYAGMQPIAVCVLRGAIPFYADLIRRIDLPVTVDTITVSSYGSGTVSGKLKVITDMRTSVEGRDVLVVDDIIDSGRTSVALIEMLKERGAKSVRTCALLDKPSRRVVDIKGDYVGFAIPDEFVVGYGLDWNEKFRNLPHVYTLKEEK